MANDQRPLHNSRWQVELWGQMTANNIEHEFTQSPMNYRYRVGSARTCCNAIRSKWMSLNWS